MATQPERANKGRLVFLNGIPSSGKSALASALHELLDEPYYYRSLDHFRAGYLDRYWLADDGTLREPVAVKAFHHMERVQIREQDIHTVAAIRHVFLDADDRADDVLASIAADFTLPPPSYVMRSSPGRAHSTAVPRVRDTRRRYRLQAHEGSAVGRG